MQTQLAMVLAASLATTVALAQGMDSPDMTHMDHAAHMAAIARQQDEVVQRGKEVMPFDLSTSLHVFTKTPDGGIQRVVARRAEDAGQVQQIRLHLEDIRKQFSQGDFSGPRQIHGEQMPGLVALQSAKPGQIAITYHALPEGAELSYVTADPRLVSALHDWFDAQVSDHGKDAVAGHQH